MDTIWMIGNRAVEVILGVAALLKNPGAPGIVAIGFGVALVIFLLTYARTTHRRKSAVKWMSAILAMPKYQSDFAANIESVKSSMSEKSGKLGGAYKALTTAWGEYAETIVTETDNGEPVARNSVRPAYFFNLEDLDFGQGFYRILPNLFVTIGLFFTFLGLIAVLQAMSGQIINDETIQTLLALASAKFIMSLSGLLASILFAVALRIQTGKIELAVHDLCAAIEDKLSFISQEEIALKQLKATHEQEANFREVGMKIAAELGESIDASIVEKLPLAIGEAISEALKPVLDNIGAMGAQGAQDAAAVLSEQLAGDVKEALGDASRHLADAAGRIGDLSDRLDDSSGRMGSQMEGAVERMAGAVEELRVNMARSVEDTGSALNDGAQNLLSAMNESLLGIRDNTSAGARAMSEAASEMRAAANTFGEELRAATENGVKVTQEKFADVGNAAAGKITEAAQTVARLAEQGRDEIMGPLNGLVESLGEMTRGIDTGTRQLTHMSDSVRQGADAVSTASHNFTGASQELVSATGPIAASTRQVENAATSLEGAMRGVSATMVEAGKQTALSARDTLRQATEILDSKRRGIADALDGVQDVVAQMKGQGDRLDDIDEKLGRAFEVYNRKVEEALGSIKAYAGEVQGKFSEGIDQLQAVVDQAEDFAPGNWRAS